MHELQAPLDHCSSILVIISLLLCLSCYVNLFPSLILDVVNQMTFDSTLFVLKGSTLHIPAVYTADGSSMSITYVDHVLLLNCSFQILVLFLNKA